MYPDAMSFSKKLKGPRTFSTPLEMTINTVSSSGQCRLVNEKTSAHSLRQALTDSALVILSLSKNMCDAS